MSGPGIPPSWRALIEALNGPPPRVPDGTPGVRDVDAPCEDYQPAGAPWKDAPGTGGCDTDGHYLCRECVHISEAALRWRRDECATCGTKLAESPALGEHCPACDTERVAREAARARNREARRAQAVSS